VLRFTLEAMAAIEGRRGLAGAQQLMMMLWAMLLHEDRPMTLEELGDMIDHAEALPLSNAVHECLSLAAPPPAHRQRPASPPDWMRLWSYADQDLGVSTDRFWRLTPRQFAALSDRHEEAYIRSLHGAAMVSTTLANIHRDAKKHAAPYTPAGLYPALFTAPTEPRPERAKKIEAVRDLKAESRRIFAAMGERTQKVRVIRPDLRPRA
jgi:hypothetical protein